MAETTVLDVVGLHWATSAPIIESALQRRPGVIAVTANAANHTASVTFDPAQTTARQLSQWVRDCGFHCQGRSVPAHICDPMSDPTDAGVHGGRHVAGGAATPHDVMGHGGHGSMSMDAMVRDMRNRFLGRTLFRKKQTWLEQSAR